MTHIATLDSGATTGIAIGPIPVPSTLQRAGARTPDGLPGPARGSAVPPVAPPARRRGQALIEHLRHITEAIVRRWQRAGTESALNELDARTLRDIGLDRSEISSLAAEAHGVVPATRIRAIRYSPQAMHC
jgi:uncharacterized protein YjiS (DUF1127 family)